MKDKILSRIINQNKTLMVEIKRENNKKNVYIVETNEDLEHIRTLKIGISELTDEDLIHFIGVMDIIEILYNNDIDLLKQILKDKKLIVR